MSSTATTTPSIGAACAKVIGRPELADDPEYLDRDKRAERMPPRSTRWSTAWTRQHTKHEAMQILGEAGIPAGAVLDTGDLLAEPTFESARHHPDAAPPERPTAACRPSRCASTASRPRSTRSPLLGEHTGEVFGAWLGLSAGDVAGLKDEGVI